MDSVKYNEYLRTKDRSFESICARCGDCCGANDDPCINLVKVEKNRYFCKNYEKRFGRQRTVSGRVFNCVPIREHMEKGTLRPGCSYRAL